MYSLVFMNSVEDTFFFIIFGLGFYIEVCPADTELLFFFDKHVYLKVNSMSIYALFGFHQFIMNLSRIISLKFP
jgi:hypothetical protein